MFKSRLEPEEKNDISHRAKEDDCSRPGLVLWEIKTTDLKKTTAKVLYAGFTSSFPPPKIEYKFDVEWGQVWKRLQSPMLEPRAREVLFMLINNIVANRDRLFNKFHMVPSPNCLTCRVMFAKREI